MANLLDLLCSYSLLQRSRYTDEISKLVTADGIITITVRGLMAFRGIEDESSLKEYEYLFRKGPATSSLRQVISGFIVFPIRERFSADFGKFYRFIGRNPNLLLLGDFGDFDIASSVRFEFALNSLTSF